MAIESKTKKTYSADGTQSVFLFPFDYLRKSFVYVTLNGVLQSQGAAFSIVNKQAVFAVNPIGTLVIYRETSTSPLVTWADGSVLLANDMTVQMIQALHLIEETADKVGVDLAGLMQNAVAASEIAEAAATAAGVDSAAAGVAKVAAESAAVEAAYAAAAAEQAYENTQGIIGFTLDPDATMEANSDTRVPTQKAAKAALATKVNKASSTDKAITRFSGSAGELQDSSASVDDNGNVITPAGGLSPFSGGYKNKIINGNFGVNQRGVSGTVNLSAGAYGHDRWKAGTGGCTYTFSTVAGVTTITIAAGTLKQVVEGNGVGSGLHILTWSGTAQGKVDGGSYSASGVSATLTGGTNVTIEFGAGTLSLVQLEMGNRSTPFESRHPSQELSICQRYFEKLAGIVIGTYAGSGETSGACWEFKVEKRVVPSVTLVGCTGSVNNTTTGHLVLTGTVMTSSIGAGTYVEAEL